MYQRMHKVRNPAKGLQGFRQFCKVADIVLKAPDVTVFGTGRCLTSAKGTSYLGESGAVLPQKTFKIKHSEMPFPAFLEPRNQFPSKA